MFEKSMMLVTSSWNSDKTFKMMPISSNCPYVECIFDPKAKVLAVMSNLKKNIFHMIPKLDPNGDPEFRKTPAKDGVPIKQERRSIETFQEYYVEQPSEIVDFIKGFAANADTFDYNSFLTAATEEK